MNLEPTSSLMHFNTTVDVRRTLSYKLFTICPRQQLMSTLEKFAISQTQQRVLSRLFDRQRFEWSAERPAVRLADETIVKVSNVPLSAQ